MTELKGASRSHQDLLRTFEWLGLTTRLYQAVSGYQRVAVAGLSKIVSGEDEA